MRSAGLVRKHVVRVAMEIAALGIVIYLLQADAWVALASGGVAPGGVNDDVYVGLLCLSIDCGVAILIDGWRLMRDGRQRRQERGQQTQTA